MEYCMRIPNCKVTHMHFADVFFFKLTETHKHIVYFMQITALFKSFSTWYWGYNTQID